MDGLRTTATGVLIAAIAALVMGWCTPMVAEGESAIVVTVQELIQRDHRLTVPAGTEVLWRDSHFERVWFPTAAEAPRVERAELGFRTTFQKPGTYRGRFTIVGGHRSNDVYAIVVTVTER